ncbi:MAG TPA: hypothetical protein VK668_13930 [Mucilaginibacter sp.]|nr:hypothetical protein [Mucilaginibacter sp.]
MKRKIITTAALVCCIAICLAAAIADLTGKWTGTLKMAGDDDFPLSYTFKVDGDKLTGTANTPDGVVDITGGKITGNDFTFSVPVHGNDIAHAGKYYADSVGMDITIENTKFHSTLKRADK